MRGEGQKVEIQTSPCAKMATWVLEQEVWWACQGTWRAIVRPGPTPLFLPPLSVSRCHWRAGPAQELTPPPWVIRPETAGEPKSLELHHPEGRWLRLGLASGRECIRLRLLPYNCHLRLPVLLPQSSGSHPLPRLSAALSGEAQKG